MTSITALLAGALGAAETDEELKLLTDNASVISAPAGHKLFASCDNVVNFVMLAEGTARVQISTKSGREMILYRLEAGQSCALTTSCLIKNSPYYAEGVSETPLKLVVIPSSVFRQALGQYPVLAMNLIHDYAERIGQLTGIIDRLVSRDLYTELHAFLSRNSDHNGIVAMSHQRIAEELGSSREVISRKLKVMQDQELVTISRGKVILLKALE